MSLTALDAEIAERRRLVGDVIPPRNAGTRRTPSKKALLEEIAKTGGNW